MLRRAVKSSNTELFCFSDLDPCLNVNCPSFGVCKTYSAHEARCVCLDDCPTYQDPVCTANGTTYENKCWHELSYCRGLDNNLVYHPGSCEGWWERHSQTVLRVMKMNWCMEQNAVVQGLGKGEIVTTKDEFRSYLRHALFPKVFQLFVAVSTFTESQSGRILPARR